MVGEPKGLWMDKRILKTAEANRQRRRRCSGEQARTGSNEAAEVLA